MQLARFVNVSPWIAISGLTHVIVFAILGVVYLQQESAKLESSAVLDLTLAAAPFEAPAALPPPPPNFDRESVVMLPEAPPGPPDPNASLDPELMPGPKTDEYIPELTDPTRDPGILNPDPLAIAGLPSGAKGATNIGVGDVGRFGETSPFASRFPGGGGPGGGGTTIPGGDGPTGSGDKEMNRSVLSALRWLADHQSPDGRWDCDGFDERCTKNVCDGRGESTYDAGVTGLALLCFLGAGYTHQSAVFGDNVKRGLKYLESIQTEEGLFGAQTSQHFQYNHACAALAMAEAYGMTQANAWKDSAQRAIGWVLRTRNPYRAWRYGIADGDNDTSVTGWMTMALKSAAMAQLETEQQALADAATYVDEMTDPLTGRTGYQARGTPPARALGKAQELFPAENSESLTAVGLLTRIFAGRQKSDDPMIMKGAGLLVQRLPKWDPPSIDFYYWYYGSLAMHQIGGEPWARWNDAMKSAILDHQRTNDAEDEYGSWDPIDPWSAEGGRIYATALNCLCMEVHYRYPRVFGTDVKGDPARAKPR